MFKGDGWPTDCCGVQGGCCCKEDHEALLIISASTKRHHTSYSTECYYIYCCKAISPVFTVSLAKQRVPDAWSHANVTPVFKKGDILVNSTVWHNCSPCNKQNYQRKRHSTASCQRCLSNLLTYLEEITQLVDECNCVDVVSTHQDSAKAFEKVPH